MVPACVESASLIEKHTGEPIYGIPSEFGVPEGCIKVRASRALGFPTYVALK